MLCLCARLFICVLWSTAGKGLTSGSRLWCITMSLSLSHWYPGSGVVLDCIDSLSLHPYLLCVHKIVHNLPWLDGQRDIWTHRENKMTLIGGEIIRTSGSGEDVV